MPPPFPDRSIKKTGCKLGVTTHFLVDHHQKNHQNWVIEKVICFTNFEGKEIIKDLSRANNKKVDTFGWFVVKKSWKQKKQYGDQERIGTKTGG